MRFGICARPEEAEAILSAGFDYIEVGASGFNGLQESWDPAPYAGLPIPATNLFFDPRVHLFGRERRSYRPYADRTIERAASLGVETMVVGSGKSRRAPDEFDGISAFVEVLTELQQIATPYGITLAPESLNAEETNVGNHIAEFLMPLFRSESGVGFTADSYHLLKEWDRAGRHETLEWMWQGEIVWCPTHVHLGPLDRGMPHADDPMLRSFAHWVKEEVGYDGLVSLEVNRGSDFDLARANDVMRELFA